LVRSGAPPARSERLTWSRLDATVRNFCMSSNDVTIRTQRAIRVIDASGVALHRAKLARIFAACAATGEASREC
jgi:hypothetical protein